MKRLLQIVAVVLAASLTAGPVLAACGCGESGCGQRTMVCCHADDGMAAMAMRGCADDAARMLSAQCPGGCCATVGRPVATVQLASRALTGRMPAAAPVAWRDDLRRAVAAPTGGRIVGPQRPRYLLFRDLRI